MRQTDSDLGRIRDYLQDASFAQQDRLPPERELAERLGLTRNRLRTGLKKLAAEGLIWRHVGRGTFFGPRLRPAGIPFPVDPLQDLTNPREVMTARLAIEPPLARLAAHHATGRDLLEIEACLTQMRSVRDWSGWELLDCRLHRAIARAAGNALMLVMFDTVQANRNKETWGRLREPIALDAALARVSGEHAAIVEALRDRDADAAEAAMRAHLRAVERSIFGELD
jgi:GntR family transcriptional repressor for pyruvate dehydrogenase complex